ncbi:hypothetical protein BVRB_030620, partial [Beta vulgaris subsp. vulgaris]
PCRSVARRPDDPVRTAIKLGSLQCRHRIYRTDAVRHGPTNNDSAPGRTGLVRAEIEGRRPVAIVLGAMCGDVRPGADRSNTTDTTGDGVRMVRQIRNPKP